MDEIGIILAESYSRIKATEKNEGYQYFTINLSMQLLVSFGIQMYYKICFGEANSYVLLKLFLWL